VSTKNQLKGKSLGQETKRVYKDEEDTKKVVKNRGGESKTQGEGVSKAAHLHFLFSQPPRITRKPKQTENQLFPRYNLAKRNKRKWKRNSWYKMGGGGLEVVG